MVNFGGRHFARKYTYEKFNKMSVFYVIFARKIFSLDFGANALCPVSYYPCQGQ